ncbi:MAG TPA: hypothetical protein VF690_19720 [Hymenobacter sp.]|jgi:hypothetical protein
MPAFQLQKWYADVVDPATGHLAICYDSELRWKGLAFRFTNLLRFEPPGMRFASASFVHQAQAGLNEDQVLFTLKQRGVRGTWQRQAPALRELLLETAYGSVLWECHFPAATAQVLMGETVLHGLGYVEKLTLTLPPWHLPLQTLRWGRFVAPGHCLVWIKWEGPEPRHLVFYNGTRYADTGHIGDNEVQVGPFRLAFEAKHSLRAGLVGKTVFQRFPWFKKLFPVRILHLDEAKWLSAATLTEARTVVATGYAVHERVEWPS